MKVCSGPCEQGKKPCPCPMSCEMPENTEAFKWIVRIVLIYIAIAGLVISVSVVASCTG